MMKNKPIKILLIIVAALVGIIAVLVALTYPGYHSEMRVVKERLIANSIILKTEQGDIEFAVEGEGTPVLLLHGAGGGYDQGTWYGKLMLGDGYKFISVSRYGYLQSPIPEDASIRGQSTLYKLLLDYLDIKRVIVIGGSAGGPSATQFANDYPEQTSALILLSAVSMGRAPEDKDPFIVNIINLIQQSDYVYWLVTKSMQSTFLDFLGIPKHVYDNFNPEQKKLAQEMLDIMHPMSQRYEGTINDGKMLERDNISTSNIIAPKLIIHAKDDGLVSYYHAENANRKINGSKLISFDTGGHAMLSQIDKVREHVKEFLGTVE
jgi:pimeloyl-ACP methyl ester carboxylesterase